MLGLFAVLRGQYPVLDDKLVPCQHDNGLCILFKFNGAIGSNHSGFACGRPFLTCKTIAVFDFIPPPAGAVCFARPGNPG